MTTRQDLVAALFARERRYFEAAAQGRLLLLRCAACSRLHGPFDHVCPCGSGSLVPHDAAGSGTVHALTRVHRPAGPDFEGRAPYWVAVVELDEGVRLVATLDPSLEAPSVGTRVVASFTPCGEGVAVPEFREMLVRA